MVHGIKKHWKFSSNGYRLDFCDCHFKYFETKALRKGQPPYTNYLCTKFILSKKEFIPILNKLLLESHIKKSVIFAQCMVFKKIIKNTNFENKTNITY